MADCAYDFIDVRMGSRSQLCYNLEGKRFTLCEVGMSAICAVFKEERFG